MTNLTVILGILCLGITIGYSNPIDLADKEAMNQRTKQEAKEQQRHLEQKDSFLQKDKKDNVDISLPEEPISFFITTIKLEGQDISRFFWLKTMLKAYNGRKIGMEGINIIVKRLSNALIEEGYTTTRILLPAQDISQGTLRLTLIPGKIKNIRFKDPSYEGNWFTAFPTQPGDILNLRNLEQGLEQMKRVPSQDVNFEIVPGLNPGESDVVISMKKTKPWKRIISVDDSGSRATGKLQSSLTLSWDNLFDVNDLFNVSFNKDGDRKNDLLGTQGNNLYYSRPYGYWTFTLSANKHAYHQTVEGDGQNFLLSGESKSLEFSVEKLIQRNQNSKTSLKFGITHKRTRSYIDDTEVQVQHKNVTAAQAAFIKRLYRGKTVIDGELAYKWGVPWFQSQADLDCFPQTNRYKIWTVNINVVKPIQIANKRGRYSMQICGQTSNSRLFASEFFSIGNRYTVRGFDGEETLAAEKGWYIRNELGIPLNDEGQEVYVGFDFGKVYGPYTKYLTGTELAGLTLGTRGSFKEYQYDIFIGWPLKKPKNYKAENTTLGFNLIYQM